MKTFAATNKDGSCLWCGSKLRWACDTKYADTDKPPRSCNAKVRSPGADFFDTHRCGGKEFKKTDEGWRCADCRNIGSPRKVIVSRKRYHALPGFSGNGFFCTLDCALRFALTLAREGRRLVSREKKTA